MCFEFVNKYVFKKQCACELDFALPQNAPQLLDSGSKHTFLFNRSDWYGN